ncbi:MAG: GAF domain-containing protein [Polyangiaceae bacterium]|nr:GAF domain-containing protein [Polyangiaceae bacterium]
MIRLPPSPADRLAAQREGLLALTRLTAGAQHGGTFSESLEIVAQTLGCDAFAAYDVDRTSLSLVAHRGLTNEARVAIERLPRNDEPWFIAARATKTRRVVVEGDVAASTTLAAASEQLGGKGKLAAASAPLVSGREVLGVFVLFHRRFEAFDAAACAFLETAAGIMTLARKTERIETGAHSRREVAQLGTLAMAGMLAAHFADDVRGPLAAVALALREQDRTLLKVEEPGANVRDAVEPLRQLIHEGQLAVKRAQRVTDQIVSAAQAGKKERLVFADVLKDALGAAAHLAHSRSVSIVQQIDGDRCVLGRKSDLVPAFGAILENAIFAAAEGPRTRKPAVKVTVEDDPRGVAVSIEDTGPGVAADLRSRIFEPFFTTREGSPGIGLTLAKHAVISASGHIEISTSSALGGALFRVVLPLATTEKKKVRRTSLSSATLRVFASKPSLLWLDRDEVFLTGAKRALASFELRTASTAEQGEELMLEGQPPEIIFCEIDLPDRNGIDLHEKIARKSPDLAARFVFVTDGVLSPERAAYVLKSGCPTIVKPIDLEDIFALVQHASGERAEPSSRKTTVPEMRAPAVDDPFDF